MIEKLVARNRRLAWQSETHQDAREPLLARLDRWVDSVHDWMSQAGRRLVERRLRPVSTESAMTRPRSSQRRPARTRFDGPLPRRRPMVALKSALRDTCEQVGATHNGEPVWYRISASQLIPVLNPTRK